MARCAFAAPKGVQLKQELVLFARQILASCHGGPGGRLPLPLRAGSPTFRADLLLLGANPRDGIRHLQRGRAVVLRGRVFDQATRQPLLDECCVAPPLSVKAAAMSYAHAPPKQSQQYARA